MKPVLPCRSIPPSCGAERCSEYATLVASYDTCAEAAIPSALAKLAILVARTSFVELAPRFWETLRAWNAAASGIKVIVCQLCGEFRADRLQGESSSSQHWDIVGFEPPNTCLMATHNCQHSSFKIMCLTCGSELDKAIVKIVDRPVVPSPKDASHVN